MLAMTKAERNCDHVPFLSMRQLFYENDFKIGQFLVYIQPDTNFGIMYDIISSYYSIQTYLEVRPPPLPPLTHYHITNYNTIK